MAVHVVRSRAENTEGERRAVLVVLDAPDGEAAVEGAAAALEEGGWQDAEFLEWGEVEPESLNGLGPEWHHAFEAALSGSVGIFIYSDPLA